MLRSFHALLTILLFSLIAGMTVQAQEQEQEQASQRQAPELPDNIDVRFVVDVSGSMERTDPDNLRAQAVPMLAELMPEGARSGLWTFGRYVNMLVPQEEVDDQWRQEMRDARSRIGSPGQYTHMGRALETATEDFWPGGGYDNTHVVLLTDGMVDVPEGEEASQEERERILDDVLGHFREHGARLHTIALSDEADRPLLEQLAAETGGHHAIARSDSELISAFLSAFGAASPTEEVPLENNGFSIDDSVDEFTALIFRDQGSDSAELVDPSGNRVTRNSLPEGARWHRAETYDLVTIEDPATGRWEVDAMVGPDSRIKVVSELRMAVGDLPTRFFASDVLDLNVTFYEDGDRLTDEDFLGVMDVRAEIRNAEGDRQGTVRLSGDRVPANGVFNGEIETLTEPGQYEVRFIGEGETFQRSQRQEVTLTPPFDTEIQGQGTGEDSRWTFRVIPRDPGLVTDSIQVEAAVTGPDGETRTRDLESVSGSNDLRLTLSGDRGEGTYQVRLRMEAETQDGRSVSLNTPAFSAEFPRQSDGVDYQAVEPEARQPEPAPEPETPSEPEQKEPLFDPKPVEVPEEPSEPEPEQEPEQQAEADSGINWLLWGSAGGGLIGLGAVAGGLWWWLRRRGASKEPEPEQEETEAVAEAEQAEALSDQEEPAMEADLEPEEPDSEPEADEGTSLAEAAAAYQAQQLDAGDETSSVAEDTQADSSESADESIPMAEDMEASEASAEPEPEPEPEPASESVETAPEPETEEAPVTEEAEETAEPDEAIPTLGDDESPEDPEALADQILEENQQNTDEDEFSLEDFDISEFDDLPDQGGEADSGEEDDDGNRDR
ncbi:MAG: vWA domain-containing protein [Halospina sp.]